MLKIGIDLDDCITYCPLFFKALTNAMRSIAEIHIITNREQTKESEAGTRKDLEDLGIYYHHLVVTADKADYIIKHGINIYFDDTDEYFLNLPESVTVFKIREPLNFDFEDHRWLYTKTTGKLQKPSQFLSASAGLGIMQEGLENKGRDMPGNREQNAAGA